MGWDKVGFVKASKIREQVLRQLSTKELTPKDIAKSIGAHFPQVSLALKELNSEGLIECLTNERKKGKIYGITSKGQDVLKKL